MAVKNYKTLREPIMVGEYRLFGDILPFIGFETVEASAKEVAENYGMEIDIRESGPFLYGSFFSLEWFGRGVSIGGFRVPVKD